jgi:hypothetical protein
VPFTLLSNDIAEIAEQAAAPIAPHERGRFLEELATELGRHEVVGPGLVHRTAAELQHRFTVMARKETSLCMTPRHLPRSKTPGG